MSKVPNGEEMEQKMFQALSSVMQEAGDGPVMVSKFVVLLEVVDGEGLRHLWTFGGPDLTAWDGLGMLMQGIQVQQAETTANRVAGED